LETRIAFHGISVDVTIRGSLDSCIGTTVPMRLVDSLFPCINVHLVKTNVEAWRALPAECPSAMVSRWKKEWL
jgi:hypothetical protein